MMMDLRYLSQKSLSQFQNLTSNTNCEPAFMNTAVNFTTRQELSCWSYWPSGRSAPCLDGFPSWHGSVRYGRGKPYSLGNHGEGHRWIAYQQLAFAWPRLHLPHRVNRLRVVICCLISSLAGMAFPLSFTESICFFFMFFPPSVVTNDLVDDVTLNHQ